MSFKLILCRFCKIASLVLTENGLKGRLLIEESVEESVDAFLALTKTCSVASRRNLGTTFPTGGLVYLPQYQQNVIDLYCFARF